MSDYYLANAAAEVQAILHTLITSDMTIQSQLGLPVRAYDEPPDGPDYPYLTYGAMRSEDLSADDAPLSRHVLTLHVWSDYVGRAEVLAILRDVQSVLESGTVLRVVPIYVDVVPAPNRITWHGLLRLAVYHRPDAS